MSLIAAKLICGVEPSTLNEKIQTENLLAPEESAMKSF